ncbi:MAG: type 3 dihydrofolate reductase [Gammaproteobacteria bacterium]|jgi:dihydrofolate reductase
MSSSHKSPGRRLKISLIWAMAKNRVIGIDNRLPWKLPADMKWFRRHTLGKPVVMGRNTFESFGGRPLPDRTNIVVTQDANYRAQGAIVTHSIDEALKACGDADEVMIIGGMSLYEQSLPMADRLYMTIVDADFDGDAWFPVIDPQRWIETERHRHDADDKNPYRCTFSILERKPK